MADSSALETSKDEASDAPAPAAADATSGSVVAEVSDAPAQDAADSPEAGTPSEEPDSSKQAEGTDADVPAVSAGAEATQGSDVASPEAADVDSAAVETADEPLVSTDTSREARKAQESPVERVARIWTEYAKGEEKLANDDRLTHSSVYRQWVKTADLDLPEGVAIPPFTEVWLVLNSKSEKPAAASTSEWGRGRRGRRRKGEEDQPWLSKANLVSVNGDKAHTLKEGTSGDDPLATFAAEAHSIYTKDDGKSEGEEPDGVIAEQSKEAVLVADSQQDDGAVVLGSTEDGTALERELDRRAAHRAGRSDAGSSRLDEPLPTRTKASSSAPGFSRVETLEMFDAALRDICQEGLPRELPIKACIVSDRMRRLSRKYHIEQTPFDKYGDLVRAAEQEGLIKVERDRSQLMITWVKHKYSVVPRDPMAPMRRGSGGRGRDRRRAGDVRGSRGGDRTRGGRERPPRERERAPRERERAPRERERAPRHRERTPRGRERSYGRPLPRKRPLSASPEYSYCYEYTDDESYSYEPPIQPHRSTFGGGFKRRR